MARETFPAQKNPGVDPEEINTDPTNTYKGKPTAVNITHNLITLPQLSTTYKGREIYVINNSKALIGAAMKIPLTVFTSDSSEQLVEIAVSWLPQRLSDHVTVEDLVRSTNLRTALSKQSLLLVNPDFAEALLITPTGMQEQAYLAKKGSDLSGYGALMEGKDPATNTDYEVPKPQIPAEIREVQNIRPELIGAVSVMNVASVVSIVTMAIVNEDLSNEERGYIRSRMSDKQVLELINT